MIKDLIQVVKDLTELLGALGPLILAGGVVWTGVVAELNRRRTNVVEKKVDAVVTEQAVAAEKVVEVKDALASASVARTDQIEAVVAKVEEVKAAVVDNTQKTEQIAAAVAPAGGA